MPGSPVGPKFATALPPISTHAAVSAQGLFRVRLNPSVVFGSFTIISSGSHPHSKSLQLPGVHAPGSTCRSPRLTVVESKFSNSAASAGDKWPKIPLARNPAPDDQTPFSREIDITSSNPVLRRSRSTGSSSFASATLETACADLRADSCLEAAKQTRATLL